MVTKVDAPEESPEAKAARERAEAAAEKRQIGETRRGVSAETDAILRRFGIKAAMAGSPGAGSFAAGGFGGGRSGSSGGFFSSVAQNVGASVGGAGFGGSRGGSRNTSIAP